MGEKTQHVAESKKETVAALQKLLLKSKVVAALNVENLPANKLANLRSQTRSQMSILMTKRRLINHAIELVKDKRKDIVRLKEFLTGMPALLFTEKDPFSLFLFLKKSKSKAAAKAGQIAPYDLVVQKGLTPFAPGPIIGELAMLGIKSGVEGGKVAIKEDSVVAKEGEVITQKKAEVLARLGVEPMEVGLNITAAYEDGIVYPAKVLDIDEKQFFNSIAESARQSFNLACAIAYTIKETISLLIGKAFADARAIGLQQNIIDEGIIEQLLARAESSALGVKAAGNITVPEKPTPAPDTPAGHPSSESGTSQEHVQETKKESKERTESIPLQHSGPKQESGPEQESKPRQDSRPQQDSKHQQSSRPQPDSKHQQDSKPKQESLSTDAPPSTEAKVKELVDKAKQFSKGEVPSAVSLIEEVERQVSAENPKHESSNSPSNEEPAQKKKFPETHQPNQTTQANQSNQSRQTSPNKQENPMKQTNQNEMLKVEQLAKELMKKGTLRK